MRYRNAMASLDELLSGMYAVWTAEHDSQKAFLQSNPPPEGFTTYRPGANDSAATAKVMELAEELERLGHPAAGDHVPRAEPDLRLMPPI